MARKPIKKGGENVVALYSQVRSRGHQRVYYDTYERKGTDEILLDESVLQEMLTSVTESFHLLVL